MVGGVAERDPTARARPAQPEVASQTTERRPHLGPPQVHRGPPPCIPGDLPQCLVLKLTVRSASSVFRSEVMAFTLATAKFKRVSRNEQRYGGKNESGLNQQSGPWDSLATGGYGTSALQ